MVPDDPNAASAAPLERPYMPRNVYTKPADLAKYGYTSGCRRCAMMRQGRSIAGTSHTSVCRDRIIKALADAGDSRVQAVADRANEEIARQVEAGDSTRNQAQEEEGAAAAAEVTPVAPYRGQEAATRVYSKRVQE